MVSNPFAGGEDALVFAQGEAEVFVGGIGQFIQVGLGKPRGMECEELSCGEGIQQL